MKPQDLRAHFPALDRGLVFLDWAATGLVPSGTQTAIHRYVDDLATCPTAASTHVHAAQAATRNRAREQVGGILNAKPDDVALVANTTEGLQIASECIRLQPGDNVLVAEHDYLAVALPWLQRRRSDKIEVRQVPGRPGELMHVDDMLKLIDDRTRVVAVSTVGWTTGALLDLPAIAGEVRARGLLLVVDGVQTFGVVPVDMKQTEVSYYSVGGHKWLCSTLGAGFLYVNPFVAARSRPTRFGFLAGLPSTHRNWWEWFTSGTASLDEEVVFPSVGRSFESGGTPSYPGAIGIAEMTELIGKVGVPAIADHVRALGTDLIQGLDALGLRVLTPREPERRAGIVVFVTPGAREGDLALVEKLKDRRIAVSARWAKGVGGVRVSMHAMNLPEDVDRLLVALKEILRS